MALGGKGCVADGLQSSHFWGPCCNLNATDSESQVMSPVRKVGNSSESDHRHSNLNFQVHAIMSLYTFPMQTRQLLNLATTYPLTFRPFNDEPSHLTAPPSFSHHTPDAVMLWRVVAGDRIREHAQRPW